MAESEELLEAKAKLTSQLSAELDQQQQDQEVEEKVRLTVGLENDDDGDEWSSCSDRSFETFESVDTDSIEIRARSNSVGSQTSMNSGIKKHRRRRQKGGFRHRRHQKYQFGKDIELELSQKALYLKEKDKAAALRRLQGEEELVYTAAAPYNSTQFIMEEYDKNFPHVPWDSSHSASNSPPDRNNSAPLTPTESNHEVIHCVKEDKEFTDSLLSAQAECLQSLPKDELVKNFINLEEKVADLHKQVTQGEHQQKQEQDEEDLYSPDCGHVNNPYVCESVYNSETNSLSSNNEEYVDLSEVNHQPVYVDESSDDTLTLLNANSNSSGCSS